MSVFLQPIYTQTLGVGGANSITFNNIPQTFTDLKLVLSGRSSYTPSPVVTDGVDFFLYLNSDNAGTSYSDNRFYGNGSVVGADRSSNQPYVSFALLTGSGATANTFGSADFYLPNYTSANFKSWATETVGENNNATGWCTLYAGLWQSTSAITSLTILSKSAPVQYSTFSLYGVLRQGI
jgi:hypothetical protein